MGNNDYQRKKKVRKKRVHCIVRNESRRRASVERRAWSVEHEEQDQRCVFFFRPCQESCRGSMFHVQSTKSGLQSQTYSQLEDWSSFMMVDNQYESSSIAHDLFVRSYFMMPPTERFALHHHASVMMPPTSTTTSSWTECEVMSVEAANPTTTFIPELVTFS
jgi:hypothetical protein